MRDSSAIIKQILEKRGITDPAEFFSGKPQEAHDPFLIPGMEKGAETVFRHISEGKKICVYGDYDVDGLMSVTLLAEFLGSLPGVAKGSISWYIPSRFDEGYGLNLAAIEQIRDDGADLIVTVDCGIASAVEAAAAMDMGMEIVVTDHHEPNPSSIPACPAIDPDRKSVV
jgi:single-stranded-DNA-specific exonuclease